MILTWARAAHEFMLRMAVAINGVRKLFIWNAPPLRLASFRNQRERARRLRAAPTGPTRPAKCSPKAPTCHRAENTTAEPVIVTSADLFKEQVSPQWDR